MKITIFTGAGLSAESGISTFRDINGLWENHKIEEVCNIKTFENHKNLVFDFYNKRRAQLKECLPSSGHLMIKQIQDKYGIDNVNVLTQNVDDLLEKAGVENVIHLHGNLKEMQCLACKNTWNIEYQEVPVETCCPKCESEKIKPNIVFFGEYAPNYHQMKRIFRESAAEDIVIIIGTMGNVIPINAHMQTTYGLKILCNLEESPYIDASQFKYVFYEKINEASEKILKVLEEKILKLDNKTFNLW